MRVVLSANAVQGRGGQGVNLSHMLAAHQSLPGDLISLTRGGVGSQEIPTSSLRRRIAQLPLVRRARDWTTLSDDVEFDVRVALRLPRHVDVFQGVVGQSAVSLGVARRRGAHTILDCVNHHIDQLAEAVSRSCQSMGVRSFVHPAMIARVRREYALAHRIRVMSEVSRRTFLQRGLSEDRVIVARPPIDVASCPRARFGHSTFRVGFVGLLEPWKGFDLLLDAFANAAIPDSELELWGGPGSRGATRVLERATGRGVRFRTRSGSIHELGFADTYGQMSVLVHPSLTDGFGLVVAEAMACGVPVITTDCTGASELLVHGGGLVVPAGDVDALTEALRTVSHASLSSMGAAARSAAGVLTHEAFRTAIACLRDGA